MRCGVLDRPVKPGDDNDVLRQQLLCIATTLIAVDQER